MPEDDDTDAVLAELEAETEDPNSIINQQRTQQLDHELKETKSNGTAGTPATILRHTPYKVLTSDSETLQFTTEHEKAVVHFRHKDFARCAIMDGHLERIAAQHELGESGGEDVAFGTVDVEKAPFVVERLGVRVLPCVTAFARGVVTGKVLGFQGICWGENESSIEVTKALEDRLVSWGTLRTRLLTEEYDSEQEQESRSSGPRLRRGLKSAKPSMSDDDNDDWD